MNTQGTLIGTKAVVLNRRGKILILKRSEKSSRPLGWDFPGGALEPGEDPEQGVLREIKEETGIVAEKASLFSALQAGEYNKKFTVLLAFKVKVHKSDVLLNWEHVSFQWLTKDEALALPMPKLLKTFLEKLP